MTAETTEKPALDSLTLRSVAAIAVALAASKAGVALPDGAPQEVARTMFDLIATLGLIGAAIGRTRARATLT